MLLAVSTLWIILGVIGVIIVAAIIGFFLYMNRGPSNADGTGKSFLSSDGFSLPPGVGEPHVHRPDSLKEAIAVVERYGSVWRQDDKKNGPVDKIRMGASQVYDEDLIHTIGKFKDLKHLELYNTHISDRTLRALETLDNLQYLDISGTDVTEDGIKRLQNHLPDLELRT